MLEVVFCPYNHLPEEEGASCFTLILFWCQAAVSVYCLFLVVPWFGLCNVIAVLSGHTYLLFGIYMY